MSLTMSLHEAARAAVRNGNDLSNIKVPKWALTYGVTELDVQAAFEKARVK